MALKARAPRINRFSLRKSWVKIEEKNIPSAKIANLSSTGLAVFWPKEFPNINIGEVVSANVMVEDNFFDVKITLVRKDNEIHGFMFEKLETKIASLIISNFPFEIKGQKLIKVANSALKADSDGQPYWFYDGRENELYFLIEDNKIQYFRISLSGKYIENYPGYPMLVRRYNSKDATKQMPGTRSVDEIIELNKEDLENILKFLNHIRYLEPHICQEICSYFR